jgi:hypothetical protein
MIMTRENYKPYVPIKLSEFANNSDNKNNIDSIEEIKNMILYSKKTIEDACKKFGVDEKSIPLVRLIIARELYLCGKEYIADKIVKLVKKEKSENTAVKDLLSEIIKNRRFYMNKRSEGENAPRLSLAKLI